MAPPPRRWLSPRKFTAVLILILILILNLIFYLDLDLDLHLDLHGSRGHPRDREEGRVIWPPRLSSQGRAWPCAERSLGPCSGKLQPVKEARHASEELLWKLRLLLLRYTAREISLNHVSCTKALEALCHRAHARERRSVRACIACTASSPSRKQTCVLTEFSPSSASVLSGAERTAAEEATGEKATRKKAARKKATR